MVRAFGAEPNRVVAPSAIGEQVRLGPLDWREGGMARRILHVVGSMTRGGVENWLMNVLRHLDPARYQTDFLVRTDQPQDHDPEIKALGGRLVPCLQHRNLWRFTQNFAAVMRKFGPYDVIHSHLHYFDGVILKCAARHGVPVRVAHSHADYRSHEHTRNWAWRGYFTLMRSWIRRYATLKIGVSPEAAAALFGSTWQRQPDCEVMPCGLDLTDFEQETDRAAIRSALALPPEAVVIGHVGRLVWEKNHRFLLDVAAAIMKAEPRARLLLVGDGPLRGEVQDRAKALGIADRTILAGNRADVPQLMKGAMDLFVFPSEREGLGMALLEAQAAGLPCIISNSLTATVDVVPGLVRRLSLGQSPALWAEAALAAIREPAVSRAEALLIVRNGEFEIGRSVAKLLGLYDRGLERIREHG